MSLSFGKWVENVRVVFVDIRNGHNIRFTFSRESGHRDWKGGIIGKPEFRNKLSQTFVEPDVTSKLIFSNETHSVYSVCNVHSNLLHHITKYKSCGILMICITWSYFYKVLNSRPEPSKFLVED